MAFVFQVLVKTQIVAAQHLGGEDNLAGVTSEVFYHVIDGGDPGDIVVLDLEGARQLFGCLPLNHRSSCFNDLRSDGRGTHPRAPLPVVVSGPSNPEIAGRSLFTEPLPTSSLRCA